MAFIVDGNRRWAHAHQVTTRDGHRAGAEAIARTLPWCEQSGIAVTTWWLLSRDNLHRDRTELLPLLEIIGDLADKLAATGRYRLRHLGDPLLLPPSLTRSLNNAQTATAHYDGHQVNLAVGYDGRSDIVMAVRAIARRAAGSARTTPLQPVTVTEDHISHSLGTRGIPDPDLVVRTSGEQRLSGFMPWQTAQSQIYFCPVLWPDFARTDLDAALGSFARHAPRHGL